MYTTAVAVIIGRHDLSNEVHHRNQPNKSKLALYKLSIHFNSSLKQLHISNKTAHFNYEGRRGVHKHTLIEAFKEYCR